MKKSLPLDNLCGQGKPLDHEAPDAQEYAGLKRSGLAQLQDAARPELSLESRFALAYNAAHALCLAALRRHGYRSNHRYIVFQALPHTLKLGPDVWRVLDKCHKIRNLGEYEGHLNVDERIVTDLIDACQSVADAISALPPLETNGDLY